MTFIKMSKLIRKLHKAKDGSVPVYAPTTSESIFLYVPTTGVRSFFIPWHIFKVTKEEFYSLIPLFSSKWTSF